MDSIGMSKEELGNSALYCIYFSIVDSRWLYIETNFIISLLSQNVQDTLCGSDVCDLHNMF